MMMITTQASTCYQIMKVKRPREGGFCVTFFLGFCFMMVFSFPLRFYQAYKVFLITKNLVITYKLSTIKGFYHKMNDFSTIMVFLGFCHAYSQLGYPKGWSNEKRIAKDYFGFFITFTIS